tara:strand:- start:298 stop:723 length:426 start_codon:yes stop_codon:yes gene_type:complete
MSLKDLDIIQYNASGNMLVSVATKNGEVKGVKNLIQRVIKRIFTVQGSNTYDLQLGGQLNTLFKAITEEEAQEFEETFGILLNSITEQLKEEQVGFLDKLESAEILEDLVVEKMVYDPVFQGFLITIKVVTANKVSHSVII